MQNRMAMSDQNVNVTVNIQMTDWKNYSYSEKIIPPKRKKVPKSSKLGFQKDTCIGINRIMLDMWRYSGILPSKPFSRY